MLKNITFAAALAVSSMTMTGCAGLSTASYQMKEVNQQLGIVVSAKDAKVATENSMLNTAVGTTVGALAGSLFGGGNGKIVGAAGGAAVGAGAGLIVSREDGQELTIALDGQKGKIIKAAYPIKDGVKFKKNDYVIVTTDSETGKLLEITLEETKNATLNKKMSLSLN